LLIVGGPTSGSIVILQFRWQLSEHGRGAVSSRYKLGLVILRVFAGFLVTLAYGLPTAGAQETLLRYRGGLVEIMGGFVVSPEIYDESGAMVGQVSAILANMLFNISELPRTRDPFSFRIGAQLSPNSPKRSVFSMDHKRQAFYR
jgi:hypothetical protein